ncbi:multidrug efflux transporter periplasmic adaptor subunit MdtN [Escherichia coli]|nr:multidrug efflux transporter periplasmic adaptor subunit MdtN [Escherichia coli]KYR59995.1 multidrug resistance protein MdtN [Escherichia coli]
MESTPKKAPRSKFPALLVVALALVALVFVIWRVDSAPSTNDAYASADTIDVVPEVSGRIVELAVTDNQAVKQGDLLFRIDPRPYEANLAKAEASLAALDKQIMLTQRSVDAQQFGADSVNATVEKARAAAKQARDTLRRTEPLLREGFVSAEEVDRARTAQRAAEADLNAVLLQAQSAASAVSGVDALVAQRAAEADLNAVLLQAQSAASAVSGVDALVAQRAAVEADIALTKLHLEMATVRAPFDGRVISLKTSVGQFASAMRPIFTLIDTRHWYVIANFRETDLKNIRSGTPATIRLMSDSGKTFEGKVDSIGYGVLPDDGGLVLGGLPKVSRSINWVRVAQRFPVKIMVDKPDPEMFRIGASAVANLEPQ